MGASLAISSLVYLGIAGGVVAASAAARQVVKEEDLMQVKFAQPPAPEPPPPAPEPEPPPGTQPPPTSARPKVQRKQLAPPKEVPNEKPAEADKPLADAPADEAKDGFTDGVAGGTGTAPAVRPAPTPAAPTGPVHLPERATPPVLKSGATSPAYPEAARKAGVQAVVVARVTIARDGKVTNVEVLKGPEVFHAAVKAALMSWQYEPARLPDGTPISVFRIVPLPFKLENM